MFWRLQKWRYSYCLFLHTCIQAFKIIGPSFPAVILTIYSFFRQSNRCRPNLEEWFLRNRGPIVFNYPKISIFTWLQVLILSFQCSQVRFPSSPYFFAETSTKRIMFTDSLREPPLFTYFFEGVSKWLKMNEPGHVYESFARDTLAPSFFTTPLYNRIIWEDGQNLQK